MLVMAGYAGACPRPVSYSVNMYRSPGTVGIDMPGQDSLDLPGHAQDGLSNENACSDLCRDRSGCTAYVWSPHLDTGSSCTGLSRCWLKHSEVGSAAPKACRYVDADMAKPPCFVLTGGYPRACEAPANAYKAALKYL